MNTYCFYLLLCLVLFYERKRRNETRIDINSKIIRFQKPSICICCIVVINHGSFEVHCLVPRINIRQDRVPSTFLRRLWSSRTRYRRIVIPGLLIVILATYIHYDGIWLLKGNSWKNAHYTGTQSSIFKGFYWL